MLQRILLAALLALISCGQSKPEPKIDLSAATVIWSGEVSSDPVLQYEFEVTMDCLAPIYHPLKAGSPHIIVIELGFICSNIKISAGGCVVKDTIYMTSALEYVTFPHEVIHWATGLTNKDHTSEPFLKCENAAIGPYLI